MPTSSSPWVSTDEITKKDAEFWLRTVETAMEFYRVTRVTSGQDLANKAITCTVIAAIGLSMAAYFSDGVGVLLGEDLINDEGETDDADMAAAMAAGERAMKVCAKHIAHLEKLAKENAN